MYEYGAVDTSGYLRWLWVLRWDVVWGKYGWIWMWLWNKISLSLFVWIWKVVLELGFVLYVGCKMLVCRYELRRRENVKDKHKKMQ